MLYAMKRGTMVKNTFVMIALCMLLLSLIVGLFAKLTGRGKSPNDLYTEGKTLILKQETVDEGLKILTKFEEKFPKDHRTPEVVLAHAMALQGEKRYDEAIETYRRLMDKYPQSPEAYKGMFLLGYMYYEDMKENNKALEIFNAFIKAYPDSELVTSAKVLVENISLPIEEWSMVKKISAAGSFPDSTNR